ncbi:transmembrane protein 267 isoform X1 [Strongylocentrotus purpuratus]|uniref:Transmembrane protein 267 n=2 Tax=Strongylocentrotus purpuratus TaxID=7668 RepID=A0A7M7HQL5_STRPU|nr:transmembrane protein 267 isoform X1 [Strongylocentrotus purpuratus]
MLCVRIARYALVDLLQLEARDACQAKSKTMTITAAMDKILTVLTRGRLFLTVTLAMICILGDFLLTCATIISSNLRRALIDNGTHGLVGLLSWAVVVNPTLLPLGTLVREPFLWEILLCGVLSSLVDLDHFAAAGTVKLQNALSLKSRPPCHATTLIPVICLFLLLIVRLFKLQRIRRLPLILFVAWFSHHIRDAARRGLWLWPWGSTSPLPYWLYITLIVVIPYLVISLMNVTNYWTGPSVDSKHLPSVTGVQHV